MKRRLLFSSWLIMLLTWCNVAIQATAQDTGKPHTVKTNQVKKNVSGEDDAFTPAFQHNKRDTSTPARNTGITKPAKKKDTILPGKNKDTLKHRAQMPLNDRTGDSTAHINRSIPVLYADTGQAGAGSLTARTDTGRISAVLALPAFTRDSFGGYDAFVQHLIKHNALFPASEKRISDITTLRNDLQIEKTDLYSAIFYIILGILFLLAILRITFSKYFSDLFRAFFNPALSQRQLREQLSQTPFPSFMLNLFFAISAGLYLFLVLLHYHYFMLEHPLYLIPVFTGLIIVIYLIKYAFLRFAGWLFGYRETAAGYAFTLYMVNKVMGIALLPFILILAFSPPEIADVALNISLMLIVLLFIYRYIRIYGLARNQIIFQKFHFFIYLCGFEIAPILIVGKLVLIWLNGA